MLGQYYYDAFGRRVRKDTEDEAVATRHLYDGIHVVEERDGSGDLLKKFAYGQGIDEILWMEAPDQADVDEDQNTSELVRLHYHTNSLGSVMHLTDPNEDVVEKYEFTPYGEATIKDGGGADLGGQSAVGNPYMFTARRLDEEAGLYFYRTRQYDAAQGRFLQRDPIRDAGGINLYEYVSSRPTVWTDALGTKPPGYDPVPGSLQEMRPENEHPGNRPEDDLSGVTEEKVKAHIEWEKEFNRKYGPYIIAGIQEVMLSAVPIGRALGLIGRAGRGIGSGIGRLFRGARGAGIAADAGRIAASGADDVARTVAGGVDDLVGAGSRAAEGGGVKRGIYEFPDQLAPGKKYVGQSGDVPQRLGAHRSTGRVKPGTETTTAVEGGKTAREIAEHKRIQELTGGVPARQSPAVSNKVDPIGPKRQHLLGGGKE